MPRLHQRNMLRGNKLRGLVDNKQHVAGIKQLVDCCPQQVASSNMLRTTCCRATCCAGVNEALGL